MAPPPPDEIAISFDEAVKLKDEIRKGTFQSKKLVSKMSYMLRSYPNVFVGQTVVEFLIQRKIAKDPKQAVQLGKALLHHRLAHHVNDDHDFENEYLFYRFVEDEPKDVQAAAARLTASIQSDKSITGELTIKSKSSLFMSSTWTPMFAALDPADESGPGPQTLRLYKHRSSVLPHLELQVTDCTCSVQECEQCNPGMYCFTIRVKNREGAPNTTAKRSSVASSAQSLTCCAANSTLQMQWLEGLMSMGVAFDKSDEETKSGDAPNSFYEISAYNLEKTELIEFDRFRGKLYSEYKSRGVEILAFPCNQFGKQEAGDAAQIRQFVNSYNVEFPVFEKVRVNGKDAHPAYKYLKAELGGLLGSSIKWNFTKFLIDKEGRPVKRYGPPTNPLAIVSDIEKLL